MCIIKSGIIDGLDNRVFCNECFTYYPYICFFVNIDVFAFNDNAKSGRGAADAGEKMSYFLKSIINQH